MVQKIYNPGRLQIQVPGTPAKLSADTLFKSLSNALQKEADDQFSEWKQAEIEKAEREGTLEGLTKERPEFKKGDHLTAKVYNKSAEQVFKQKTMANVKSRLTEIADQNKADPEAFEKLSREYLQNLRDDLNAESQTAEIAARAQVEGELQMRSLQRSLWNNSLALQKERMQVDTEDLITDTKNSIYKNANRIFSADPAEQKAALMDFSLAQKQQDALLHQVLPDGTPVYTPKQVAAHQENFHRELWTKAAQSRITNGELSDDEIADIVSGDWKVSVPEIGEVSVIDNIGSDNYDRAIKEPLQRRLMQENKLAERMEREQEEVAEQTKKAYGFSIWQRAIQGDPNLSLNQINEDVVDGKISPAMGEKISKALLDGTASEDEDSVIAEAHYLISQGEDISDFIAGNSDSLTQETVFKLMEDNEKGMDKLEKEIYDLGLEKDEFGFPITESQIMAQDFVDRYRYLRAEGGKEGGPLTHGQAREITLREMKEAQNIRPVSGRVPLFGAADDTGFYDTQTLVSETRQAFKAGDIDIDQFLSEIEKIKSIHSEQQAIREQK